VERSDRRPKAAVTIDGRQGIFNWVRHGAFSKSAEVVVDYIPEIEDMIVSQEWSDIVVATDRGTWEWRPR
jgi:hypothetical protein